MGRALVSARILEQIKLVISLGFPPVRSRSNLCNNFLAFRSEIFVLNFFRYTLRNDLLLLRVEIYC